MDALYETVCQIIRRYMPFNTALKIGIINLFKVFLIWGITTQNQHCFPPNA